jgi:hypothetical protein
MRFRRFSLITVLSLGLVTPLVAQQGPAPAGGADHVSAIKESLKNSIAELHGYKWVETTMISIKGEEKSSIQKSCYYGTDGQVQKTPIGEPAEQKKERGLRGKIVEKKKAEITDSMQEAIALVKQYVPPDPAKIQAARNAGNLSVVPPDAQGNVKVVIKDYLKPGDSLTLDANAATNRVTGMAVSSYTDTAKDAVGVTVTFGAFADGTVYAATTNLTVASKDLEVAITNSGYEKLGG